MSLPATNPPPRIAFAAKFCRVGIPADSKNADLPNASSQWHSLCGTSRGRSWAMGDARIAASSEAIGEGVHAGRTARGEQAWFYAGRTTRRDRNHRPADRVPAARAEQSPRRRCLTVCQSNVRQLYIGISLYCNDNHDWYPTSAMAADGSGYDQYADDWLYWQANRNLDDSPVAHYLNARGDGLVNLLRCPLDTFDGRKAFPGIGRAGACCTVTGSTGMWAQTYIRRPIHNIERSGRSGAARPRKSFSQKLSTNCLFILSRRLGWGRHTWPSATDKQSRTPRG